MNKTRNFAINFYQWTRQLHLYLGLFICPFIVLFAVSTIYLNHVWRPVPSGDKTTHPIQIPEGVEKMALVKNVMQQLNLTGEVIGRGNVRNNKTTFRVTRPGQAKVVTVDLANQTAQINERNTGFLGALLYLHLNPGPHKLPNWFFSKLWGIIADTTVYLTFFLSISGIYMWAVIKAEKKIGLIMLGAGCLSFVGIMYALLA